MKKIQLKQIIRKIILEQKYDFGENVATDRQKKKGTEVYKIGGKLIAIVQSAQDKVYVRDVTSSPKVLGLVKNKDEAYELVKNKIGTNENKVKKEDIKGITQRLLLKTGAIVGGFPKTEFDERNNVFKIFVTSEYKNEREQNKVALELKKLLDKNKIIADVKKNRDNIEIFF